MHKSLKHNFWNILSLLLVILGSIFLFLGSPSILPTRSMINAWDLGHVVLFALISFLACRNIKWLREKSLLNKWLVLSITTFFLGILIELLQYGFDRTPDVSDIWRNMVGVYIPLYFSDFNKMNRILRYAIRSFILFILLIEIKPLFFSLIDEFNAYNDFPVIADFESSFELERWHGNSKFEISDTLATHGQSSLKVQLNTAKYSGVSIDYFPADWSEYNDLKFAIFNSTSNLLELVIRIHDKFHKNNYYDRFNRRIKIEPGWNEYSIDLNDIINAPKERKIAITEIKNIAIFAVELPQPKIIYLDYLRLE